LTKWGDSIGADLFCYFSTSLSARRRHVDEKGWIPDPGLSEKANHYNSLKWHDFRPRGGSPIFFALERESIHELSKK
jgi:hypothetical protein